MQIVSREILRRFWDTQFLKMPFVTCSIIDPVKCRHFCGWSRKPGVSNFSAS